MATKKARTKTSAATKRRIADLDGNGKVDRNDAKAAVTALWEKVSDAATAAADATRKAAQSVAAGTKKTASAGKNAIVKAGGATVKAGRAVGKVAVDAGGAASRGVGVVGTTLLDLNNDGRIDEQDLKIATEQGIAVAKQVADELASSETVRGAAKAAIIVATIAIPVPLVGPAFGGAVGAGGYLTVKAVKEIAVAIGAAVGGVRGVQPARQKKKRTAPKKRKNTKHTAGG